MQRKLIWIGTILLVFGTTLAAMSLSRVYYTKSEDWGPFILTIDKKSSNYMLINMAKTQDMKSIDVKFWDFPRFDILNKTLDYGWPFGPFNITLSEGIGLRNISVTMKGDSYPQTRTFSIPDNWRFLYKLSISNPEDSPVILLMSSKLQRQLVANNLQNQVIAGIAVDMIGVGFILFPVLFLKRNAS